MTNPNRVFKSDQPWKLMVNGLLTKGLKPASLSETLRHASYDMSGRKPGDMGTLLMEACAAGLVRAVVECWVDEKGEPQVMPPSMSVVPRGWKYSFFELSVDVVAKRSMASVDGNAYWPDWLRVAVSARYNRPGLLQELLANRRLREAIVTAWALCVNGEGTDQEKQNKGFGAVRQLLSLPKDE